MKYVIMAASIPKPGTKPADEQRVDLPKIVLLFPDCIAHRDVFTGARATLWADYGHCTVNVKDATAGFCSVDADDGKVTVRGESESLGIRSNPETDPTLIENFLFG